MLYVDNGDSVERCRRFPCTVIQINSHFTTVRWDTVTAQRLHFVHLGWNPPTGFAGYSRTNPSLAIGLFTHSITNPKHSTRPNVPAD
ncbi:hypothetical protein J6590_079780 [Homalodisca vitripennis]|nr:hypothetical protein J6590_079780 [Homalodisca vitripennis]